MQLKAASMALVQWRLLAILHLLFLASAQMIGSGIDFNEAGSGMISTEAKPPDLEDGDSEDDSFPFDHESIDICVSAPIGMARLGRIMSGKILPMLDILWVFFLN